MAYRGGRGYGQSYGAFGSDQVDPLAAAIMGALGMGTQLFETVRGVRQENADRRDMANARLKAEARQAEQDAIERERWDYKVSLDQQERQDALAREKRQREQALGDRLTERGIAAIPTPMGGTTYAKVAQTDDELKAAMQDRLATDRLRQQAKALGIPDADKMSRGELEVLTSEVMKGRERDAEFGDFRRRESYQEGLIRGRPTRGAGGPNGRPLSANLADTLGSYNALIGTADDALAKFDKAAGVDPTTGKSTKALTGWFDGLRNTSLAQNLGMGMGKDATSAVAALSNLASSIMKDGSAAMPRPCSAAAAISPTVSFFTRRPVRMAAPMTGETSPFMIMRIRASISSWKISRCSMVRCRASCGVMGMVGLRRFQRGARKFRSIAWPYSVRMDSGWNCTPSMSSSRWRTPMISPSSVQAVVASSAGQLDFSMASEW